MSATLVGINRAEGTFYVLASGAEAATLNGLPNSQTGGAGISNNVAWADTEDLKHGATHRCSKQAAILVGALTADAPTQPGPYVYGSNTNMKGV
jgi:hypothetical protein